METNSIALLAHEMVKAQEERKALQKAENHIACLKAHYLQKFYEAQRHKKILKRAA